MADDDLISTSEAAEILGVSEETVRRLFDEGEISGMRTRPGPGGHRRPSRASVLDYHARQRGGSAPN